MKDNPVNEKFIWWKHGTVYHIYVLSFKDSNGDGYGDINGVIEKLDHIRSLGVSGIWLSPVFTSPMKDHGYDIKDYYSIDPVFGSMRDIEELIAGSHGKNINVILDMVMNHTSDQHPWFKNSRSSLNSGKRDWYIWHDPVSGKPPNNWQTVYGKSAWEYDKNTGQYYYHSFLPEQPDLNWRNPDVKEEFDKVFRFWLDKGVDGFRLDAVNFIVKDRKLRPNPGLFRMLSGKRKFYSRNRGTSVKLLREFRELVNDYPDRVMVGEIFALPPGESETVGYYLSSGDDTLNMAFDFSLMFQRWSASNYFKAIRNSYANIPEKGWPCVVFSNHDILRSYNRGLSKKQRRERAKLKAVIQLTLKGTPFIYYGEEIGMKNSSIPKEKIRDPLGLIYWPLYKGRDRARTPMQWNSGKYSGFSSSEPWLPVNKDHVTRNVSIQHKQNGSLLCFYKDLLNLRNKYKALHRGEWIPLSKGKNNILSYLRRYENEYMFIILNFSNKQKMYDINKENCGEIILSTNQDRKIGYKLRSFILLQGYEGLILKYVT